MVFEDKQIPAPESTTGFRHPQINAAFNPLQPNDNALAAAGQYSQIAQKWRQGVTDFAARMNRSSAAAWDGQAAEASREAIRNYTQRATDLAPELDALAARVGQAAQAITTTKDELPDLGQNFQWTSPSTWDVWNNVDPDEQEEKARQVMDQHYVKPFGDADSTIPKLSVPVSPTNPLHGGIDDGTGGGNPGGGGSGGNGGGNAGDGGNPATAPADTEDSQQEEQDPGDTDDDTTDDSSPSEESDDNGDDTTPSSATPDTPTSPSAATPTTPSAATPSTGSPGGGGGGGGGGAGGGAGSPVAAPIAGRAAPGGPTGATAAGAAGSAGAGRAGMGPMMGAPGAGRGRGNDGEDTHEIPDYLITAANTEELLGEQPRTLPEGVIGADAPAANTPPPANPAHPQS
ncbi:WXG100 family type VII secretion target [Nocardia lasii]|uniref:WXG100 family type VII secretion target n=1 Tax=Nocardia lasii TaxID=1616107 RepID=A0ABW1JKP9_9NOCA